MRHPGVVAVSLLFVVALPPAARLLSAQPGASHVAIPDIPFTKFTLANGLTVIVNEDHSAPVVHVGVWYRVGSRDERSGRTGLAHLYEHLMFEGTEHFPGNLLKDIISLGATSPGGDTWTDRTRYGETVQVGALDRVLWLESERMGFLLGAIDQKKLDAVRGGVLNERRLRYDVNPYEPVANANAELGYPPGHPYSHVVIGSQHDLDAVSLDEVRDWFRTWYAPNNAFLLLLGDITVAQAREKIERYFGEIPAGPPVTRITGWSAPLPDDRRISIEAPAPQPRVYRTWNTPGWNDADADVLLLAADILAGSSTARLNRLLVTDRRLALDVAINYPFTIGELGGQFTIRAAASDPGQLALIDTLILGEVQRLARDGPTAEEVQRARVSYLARVARGIEDPGNGAADNGRAALLGYAELFAHDPGAYRRRPRNIAAATAAGVRNAVARWLTKGAIVAQVRAAPKLMASQARADRTRIPDAVSSGMVPTLDIHRRTLANRLTVVTVRRPVRSLVQLSLIIPGGAGVEPLRLRGVAATFAQLWTLRTSSRPTAELRAEIDRLGATLSANVDEDATTLRLSVPAANVAQSVALLADVAMHPSFDETNVTDAKRAAQTVVETQLTGLGELFLRTTERLAYGADHPYSTTYDGSASVEAVAALNATDLKEFFEQSVSPDGATLIVVGDFDKAAMSSLVERHFASWTGRPIQTATIPRLAPVTARRLYLVDLPGAQQSIVGAVTILSPAVDPNDPATAMLMSALGGSYASRLNENLRLQKGWSYVARAEINGGADQHFLDAYAAVQRDKTAESMKEIQRELDELRTSHPITTEELDKVRRGYLDQFAGRWTSSGALAADIRRLVRMHQDDDYFRRYAQRLSALSPDDLAKAARLIIPNAESITWVVVGDRATVEPALRSLGWGDVQVIDGNARPVARKP